MTGKDEKMNIQQTLTDIQVLVTYVKEHLSMQAPVMDGEKLDGIGRTVLEISGKLDAMGTNPSGSMMKLEDILSADMATIEGQLSKIADQVAEQMENAKNLYSKVEDRYVACAGALEQVNRKQDLVIAEQTDEVRRLVDGIDGLAKSVRGLEVKVEAVGTLTEAVEALENRMVEIVKEDRELNKAYVENADRLDRMVQDIEASYHGLNETLVSVDGSFRTAVSRLDVLLAQIRALAKK